jgi:hypothetical protein
MSLTFRAPTWQRETETAPGGSDTRGGAESVERSPIAGPVLAAALIHALLVAAYVAAFGGDLSALVCAAKERLGHVPYERIHTGFDRNGYDGQFYYALARSPWRPHGEDIDCPTVRQARILYPAVSWLLSGGDAQRLLWVMPLVNLVAIAALAGLGARVAQRYGLSVWWGLLLPFAVNASMPALRNLTDVLSTLTLGVLLVSWLLRWPWWALALSAAGTLLSREQNVAVVLLVLAFAAWPLLTWMAHRRQERLPAESVRNTAGLLAALVLWSGWLCVLRLFYGQWSFLPAQGNMDLPLSGMLYRWTHLTAVGPRSLIALHLLCMSVLTVQMGLAMGLLGTSANRLVTLVALAGAALAIVGGVALYGDSWSYPRVFAWLPLGVWFGAVQVRWRWALVTLSAPAVLPLAVVLRAWSEGM